MDIDFWAARVQSAKHVSGVQAPRMNSSGHSSVMNDEGENEVRAWFPCPFCYIEIEISVLCAHLQEEHCFDLKNAVCPICAANLGRDAMSHFLVQHAHSVKRKKCQKSGFWSAVSTDIVRDFRELSSFLSTNSVRGNEPAPDPLLSPFLSTVPFSDTKGSQKDEPSSSATDVERSKPSVLDESKEEENEERRKRAEFIQELLISTVFFD